MVSLRNQRIVKRRMFRNLPGVEHQCLVFRSAQFRGIIEAAGGRVEAMSASHWASLDD